MALSPNQYALKVQRLETILAQKAAPKVPEWQRYGNFCKVTLNPHFLKKCKGGTKKNFLKNIPKKQPSFETPKSTLAQMALTSIQYALKGQNLQKIFVQKSGSKSARTAKLRHFSQVHPKPAFSEKVQRGDKGKFFKNRPKRRLRLKGPKALWRKWQYPRTSMHLKCKDWRRFQRRRRLQKCPNGQVMAIFARSFKTRIFYKKERGDQGKFFKNLPKSRPRLKGPKANLRKWHYPLISMHLKGKD